MLEFTNQQVKAYLIGVVIFTAIYLLIYSKKGARKNIRGYMDAIGSCGAYAVIGVFLIVGTGIARQILLQGSAYAGLIVPLGWLVIIYFILKTLLKQDFNLDISIIRLDKIKKAILMNAFIRAIIAVGFYFTTFIIFFVAVPDTANQPYGPIPLVLAGLIFGGGAVILSISAFKWMERLKK